MHETRRAELELSVSDIINGVMLDHRQGDVNIRDVDDVKVEFIHRNAGSMDVEVDLMYCHIETESIESKEFKFSLATCKQTVQNVTSQH